QGAKDTELFTRRDPGLRRDDGQVFTPRLPSGGWGPRGGGNAALFTRRDPGLRRDDGQVFTPRRPSGGWGPRG
ncbi:MAG TPA: hypothetical protein VFR28_00210, partial [Allosphingosinicella sp.]|nr:hypothetical protein [Allosphingosinicella sp.]